MINISKYIVIGKKINKVIIISVLLGFGMWGLGFATQALASLTSTTYQMNGYSFGNGSASTSSTTYGLLGQTGEVNSASIASTTTYELGPGFTNIIQATAPAAPTVTNNSSQYYNKLQVTLNTSGNPSDTLYAIRVVSGSTQYVQADGTLGANPVWQTNGGTGWTAAGFFVIGLASNTTYTFSSAAMQGSYTQSPWSATTAVATANPSFSYSLNSNSLTFPTLSPGTVKLSTTTITATVSTNGVSGAVVYAYDTNAGLKSTNTSYTIASGSNDLGSVAEGYGLQATSVGQTSGGPMESLSPYNGSANNVGILDSSKRSVFDSTSLPVTSGTGTFELMAKAGNTAAAATDYADTLTVIASGQF